MSSIRVGIDVGGTFTHAVAIDSKTHKIIGESKVLTTHNSKIGVAQGIIESLKKLMDSTHISGKDISFIAHSTTQATNALLEGDVSDVGIIGMGSGIEKFRALKETSIGDIEISSGKSISTHFRFLDLSRGFDRDKASLLVKELISEGAKSIVLSQPFSPDDPTFEDAVKYIAVQLNIPAVTSHEISHLYGLKTRTRTACVNASILPMMMDVAKKTQESVKSFGIDAPLMVMRSDGGVISIEEVKRRPLQTILSGPAASVAGALFFAKVSNAILIDVGGTSTDISLIIDGKPRIKSAVIGGHRLHIKTLDIRTIGLAGGSMVRIKNREIIDVGPRSAHIAGLKYSCFSDIKDDDLSLEFFSPISGDPDDYVFVKSQKESFAITLTCASNALSIPKRNEYAYGSMRSAVLAISQIAKRVGLSVENTAKIILDIGSNKIINEIEKIIEDYKLKKDNLLLVFCGGGAGVLASIVSEKIKIKSIVVPNHELISAIGVALSLIYDIVEKNITNPNIEDIFKIRKLAEESVISMGALPETVDVKIEIIPNKNILRACASGATELKQKESENTPEERKKIASNCLDVSTMDIRKAFETDFFEIYQAEIEKRIFFGLKKIKIFKTVVLDKTGKIYIVKNNVEVILSLKENALDDLEKLYEKTVRYDDSGERAPNFYVLLGTKFVDLSGLLNLEQIKAILKTEIEKFTRDEKLVIMTVV